LFGVTDKPNLQETILLVEDEVLVRVPIAQYLRDCGYRVIEAVNAEEAMTVLLHEETVVDIVFSDIECRAARRIWAGEWIREHRPDVLLAEPSTAPSNAKQLCAEGSVPKPYDAQINPITSNACWQRGRLEKRLNEQGPLP
jgi:CheY-like chemotaxis protein